MKRRDFLKLSLAASVGTANLAHAMAPIMMKVSSPTRGDPLTLFVENYAKAITRDSGGRIQATAYVGGVLGSIPRQIESVQFGTIEEFSNAPEFYSGVDPRFGVLAAPGLVNDMQHGQRLAADPAVQSLMLGLGADKGLHGIGLIMGMPSLVVSHSPIQRLADFNGKKIRVFGSPFQVEALKRLGATPVAMPLSDVLPALQQGAIDGAVTVGTTAVNFHFNDAAKFATETNQPAIFVIHEVSRKWYAKLPADLQQIVDRDGASESLAVDAPALKIYPAARATWQSRGGELISLPANEQAAMMQAFASVGEDVSKSNPKLHEAYELVRDAAHRTRFR